MSCPWIVASASTPVCLMRLRRRDREPQRPPRPSHQEAELQRAEAERTATQRELERRVRVDAEQLAAARVEAERIALAQVAAEREYAAAERERATARAVPPAPVGHPGLAIPPVGSNAIPFDVEALTEGTPQRSPEVFIDAEGQSSEAADRTGGAGPAQPYQLDNADRPGAEQPVSVEEASYPGAANRSGEVEITGQSGLGPGPGETVMASALSMAVEMDEEIGSGTAGMVIPELGTESGAVPKHARTLATQRPLPRVLAVANQKGGVGKTTTTVNLGAALAELDYRVLVVDLDPQGNATTGLGIDPRNFEMSMYDVIMRDAPMEDCIEPTSVKNLFAAPATIDLAGVEIELVPAFSREMKLKRAIDGVIEDFDFVLIDCPPSLGLITVNALAAATEVLVPIQCEYYALEGLGQCCGTSTWSSPTSIASWRSVPSC